MIYAVSNLGMAMHRSCIVHQRESARMDKSYGWITINPKSPPPSAADWRITRA